MNSKRDCSIRDLRERSLKRFAMSHEIIIATVSIVNFAISYYLNTNTIIDERMYADQSYQFYKIQKVPAVYPLLPILSAGPLTMLGANKFAFVAVPFVATILTPLFTYRLSLDRLPSHTRAFFASCLVACNPLMIWLSAKHMTENLFTLLLVIVFLSISRKYVSVKRAFLAGLVSFLAYLCRYPGILLFPMILVALIARRTKATVLLSYIAPFTFVVAYWLSNLILFGHPMTTETYSMGTLYAKAQTIILHWNLDLLGSMTFKVLAALGLVFGPASLLIVRKNMRINISDAAVLFSAAYFIVHLGYYMILSLSWSFAWSIDHFARYIFPISPLIISLSVAPHDNSKTNRFLLLVVCLVGIAMGIYLTIYSNAHSQVPVSWDEFIKNLQS
jgi:hypothetical protein